MSDKVSIYIPAYNAEKTIEQSIISIKNQTHIVNEIIVIDDNSSDKTVEIINQFQDIILLKNQKNMGLSFNRNLAIKKSSNEIIGAIDSDVVLDKYWLETLLNNLGQNQIVMCGGNMTEKFITNKFNAWRAKYYSQNWGEKDIINPAFLYGCNTLLLKSAWINVQGYNDKFLTNGEDIDFSNKIKSLDNSNLFYSSRATCVHLQNDNIKSLSKRIWRYHSYGYKIKKPSIYRFIKLSIKQFKFFIKRFFENIFKLNLFFVYISFIIFIDFIKFEMCNYLKNKE